MATRSRHSMGKSSQHQRKGHDPAAPPPGLQQTQNSQAHSHCAGMVKKTYEYPPAHGEVLVVMRYKRDMDRRIRNCLIRLKGKIGQPGTEGKILGLADQVHVLESTPCSDWSARDDWCIAMFQFPSEDKARRWYVSEPELKQHDFLPPSDGVQLFALKLRYLLQPGKLTFNWMEMHNVRSNSFLQHEFVDKTASLFDDQQVNHGVVFMQDPGSPTELFRLKESWIPHNANAYCVINVFDDTHHFQRIYGTERYAQLRAKRGEVCDTVSLLFTIDPKVTGKPAPGP